MANEVLKEHSEVLSQAAVKITAAQPKTPSMVVSVLKSLLPFIPAFLKVILTQVNSPKTNNILIEIRDVLISADLGDAE